MFKYSLLLVSSLFLAVDAYAQALRIAPLRVDVSSKQPNAALQLTNLTNSALPVQISVMEWSQENAKDQYKPSRDILFSPPVTSVPAGKEQVIRVRLNTKPDDQLEKQYRIYVTQLPDQSPSSGASTQFQIKFGVPVFVAPNNVAALDLALSAAPVAGSDDVVVTLQNEGQKHIRVNSVGLYAIDQLGEDRVPTPPLASKTGSLSGTLYALPGTRLQWRFENVSNRPVALRLATNESNFDPSLPISRRGNWWLAVGSELVNSTAKAE